MRVLLFLLSILIHNGLKETQGATGIGREDNFRQNNTHGHNLNGPLLRQSIPELSWHNTDLLLKKVPLVDHIILFYIPLNTACRQFMNIFLALSQQFEQEKKHVKFVKVNCNGANYGDNVCRSYNVTTVPTVVYLSSLPLQDKNLLSDGIFQRGLRCFISKAIDDINAPNATCYKGDLFLYDELKDWATIMYRLSQLNRSFDSIRQCSLMEQLRNLLFP